MPRKLTLEERDERYLAKFKARLAAMLRIMQPMSEQDMGWLKYRDACRFHHAHAELARIATKLGVEHDHGPH